MSDTPKIPIKNIYTMLCYAWDVLETSNDNLLGDEKFDNVYNLFARIYIDGTSSLVKRGFNRYYIEGKDDLSTLKGKINISESIKNQTIHNKRLICEYDDFSKDIKLNQIVKTTINILIKSPNLDKKLRDKLLKLRIYFSDIREIRLSKTLFSSLRYNRNNHHYHMLINVSQLIYEGLLINEEGDKFVFSSFIKDKQMHSLYEKFVLNFYKRHLDDDIYKVHAPKIKWNLDKEVSINDLSILPEMRTDIVIENKALNNQLIIDTKYYSKTLISSNYTEIEKVRTAHLYQILAYVSNSDFKGQVDGMLLYPTIDKEVDASFSILGKTISIKTLNLNSEWVDIHNRLIEISNIKTN